MAPTVNMGWQLFTNDTYWKSFSKLVHITRRLRLVFQLNDCVFPKDLTQYFSGYNPMIKRTDLSRRMTQLSQFNTSPTFANSQYFVLVILRGMIVLVSFNLLTDYCLRYLSCTRCPIHAHPCPIHALFTKTESTFREE